MWLNTRSVICFFLSQLSFMLHSENWFHLLKSEMCWCSGHSRCTQLELEGAERKFLGCSVLCSSCRKASMSDQETHGPTALPFLSYFALLPFALVSTCCHPQKAKLWQYRISEPLVLANPIPMTAQTSGFTPPPSFASGTQVPRCVYTIPCKWTCGNEQRPLNRKQRRRKRTFKVQNKVSCWNLSEISTCVKMTTGCICGSTKIIRKH